MPVAPSSISQSAPDAVQRGFVTHLIAQSSDDVSHKILMEKSSGVETIYSTVVVDP